MKRKQNNNKKQKLNYHYSTYFLEGIINFIMEYMNKGTLADLIKKVKKITRKYYRNNNISSS